MMAGASLFAASLMGLPELCILGRSTEVAVIPPITSQSHLLELATSGANLLRAPCYPLTPKT